MSNTAAISPRSDRLTLPVLAAYSLAGFGPAFAYYVILVMYLYYATVELGASAAVVGMIFLFARAWDGISDPMVGYLSDRTRLDLGRRRPWLLASAIPMASFGWMMFTPPSSLEGAALHAWIAVAVIGFYTAFTAFDVPHMALGAQLTQEARDRNRLFGSRQVVRLLATLAAYTLAVSAIQENGREAAPPIMLTIGVIMVLTIAISVYAVGREPADYRDRGSENPLQALRDVWGNRDARLLITVYFIDMTGIGAIAVLVPFVMRFVVAAPEQTTLVLLTYTTASLFGVPLWVGLSRRFEKRRLWLFSMLQASIGFGMLLFVGVGGTPVMLISSVLSGSAAACGLTLGQSLKADLVDVDELATGDRKEGAYFAAISFAGKLGGAIMVGFTGVALEWSGFDRELDVQSEWVQQVMLGLMGGLPLIFYLIGASLFSQFKLSESEHAQIRAHLDQRAADDRVEDGQASETSRGARHFTGEEK